MYDLSEELKVAQQAARKAGEKIIEIYDSDSYDLKKKDDDSPVTKADLAANKIIMDILKENFPDDGFLTEEEKDSKERLSKERVWIIDPLDGTKDFLAKNDEFTVNIALVVAQEPVMGVIYCPVKKELFSAVKGQGSFKDGLKINVSDKKEDLILLRSRNHPTTGLLELIKNENLSVLVVGSSLKGCLLAEGKADAYLRFGSQSEWDICAMSIIIEEAGGKITSPEGKPLKFNQENTRIHGFVASNNKLHNHFLKLHNLYKAFK